MGKQEELKELKKQKESYKKIVLGHYISSIVGFVIFAYGLYLLIISINNIRIGVSGGLNLFSFVYLAVGIVILTVSTIFLSSHKKKKEELTLKEARLK